MGLNDGLSKMGDLIDSLTVKMTKLGDVASSVSTKVTGSSYQQQVNAGAPGAPSQSGFGVGQRTSVLAQYAANYAKNPYSGEAGENTLSLTKGLLRGVQDTVALLPTTQETVNASAVAERMRFYSNNLGVINDKNPLSNKHTGRGLGGRFGGEKPYLPYYQYSIMNEAMRTGTAVGPDDVLQAINTGATYGLTTGLKNFNSGAGFSGVMGGAALASNLSPGIGLTGGMGVMANINQPQNVNMLRMLGVQVRGNNGTTMNDLPQIIEQLYTLITKNNPNPTPQDIAVSMMPGNALDSLIRQYVGDDENTRQTIVSGLIQTVKARQKDKKATLRTAGTKAMLNEFGGTTTPLESLSMRNTAELQLIQAYTETTNKAMVGTDNFIQGLYRHLGTGGLNTGIASSLLKGAQVLSTGITTFGGIRGGAGAVVLKDLVQAGGGGLQGLLNSKALEGLPLGKLKKAAAAAGVIGVGALGSGALDQILGMNQANEVELPREMEPNRAPGSAPSTLPKQFTGDITINISVPPGSDPTAYKAALVDALS